MKLEATPNFIFSSFLKVKIGYFCSEAFTLSYQGFCVCAVIYEVFQGTSKYISSPVANVVFSTEVELPMVTICNKLRMGSLPGNLTRKKLVSGNFFPDDQSIVDIDEEIEKAIQEYNYFLNLTGKLLRLFDKVVISN